jgi:molecular chaperone GrpE
MSDDQNPPASSSDPRVQELEEQIRKLTDIAARAQADVQNAKIRMEKDADELRRFALQSIVTKLVPVIDNFQRAFSHLPPDLKDHEWVKGVAAIEQELIKQAGELGLQKFSPLGEKADTARHEVLMVGPGEEGVITEVFEDGYELAGRILRPAKVKVGDGSTK